MPTSPPQPSPPDHPAQVRAIADQRRAPNESNSHADNLREIAVCLQSDTPTAEHLRAAATQLDRAENTLRDVSELLSDAGAPSGTIREGVIWLRERVEQLEQAHQHLIDKWRAHAKSNDNMLGGGPWDAGQSCALDMCADDLAALLPAPPAAPAAPTTDDDETLP